MPDFLSSILRTLRSKKRAHARGERAGWVYLFGPDGVLGPARIIDASAGGAQLSCETPDHLTGMTHLLDPTAGDAHRIETAWTNGSLAGVRYIKTVTVRGYVDAEFEPMKALWSRSAGMLPPA